MRKPRMGRSLLGAVALCLVTASTDSNIPQDKTLNRLELSDFYSSTDDQDDAKKTILISLDQAIGTLDYQFRTSIVPLLDYGAQNPEKTKPGIYCKDQCAFSISFQGAQKTVHGLQDYEDARENYRLLEKRAHMLGLLNTTCSSQLQFECSSLNLPVLTLMGQDVVLTFSGPHDCDRELAIISYPFEKQTLTVVFPTCLQSEKETVAGYQVEGRNVRGLQNIPRPEGIYLSYKLILKNDP